MSFTIGSRVMIWEWSWLDDWISNIWFMYPFRKSWSNDRWNKEIICYRYIPPSSTVCWELDWVECYHCTDLLSLFPDPFSRSSCDGQSSTSSRMIQWDHAYIICINILWTVIFLIVSRAHHCCNLCCHQRFTKVRGPSNKLWMKIRSFVRIKLAPTKTI